MSNIVETNISHGEDGKPIYMARIDGGDWVIFSNYSDFVQYLNSLEVLGHIVQKGAREISHDRLLKAHPQKNFDFPPS